MTTCSCSPSRLPDGARLKTVDDRPGSSGQPITEQLWTRDGLRLRVRILDRGASAKITVSEAAADDGDVAVDANGAHVILQDPMFGGAVVPLPATGKEAALTKAVERKIETAFRAAAVRRALAPLLGRAPVAAPPCPTCGGEPRIKDVSAAATHRDPNDIVLRSPAGYWLRLRFWRVEPPKDTAGQDSADWIHIAVSAAQAKDETGDVLEDERGHRIFGATTHAVALASLVPGVNGRPGMSVEALLADRLATFALTQAEANIAQRDVLMAIPMLFRPVPEQPPLPPMPQPPPSTDVPPSEDAPLPGDPNA